MKYLVVLAVIAVAIWIWRNNRRDEIRAQERARAVPGPQAMVRCAQCGVHLPAGEALTSRNGLPYYCTEAHRKAAEG